LIFRTNYNDQTSMLPATRKNYSVEHIPRPPTLTFDEVTSDKSAGGVPKTFFDPWPVALNTQGSSDQSFLIAVISEYVSKFGGDPFVTLGIRQQKERKRKNAAVKC